MREEELAARIQRGIRAFTCQWDQKRDFGVTTFDPQPAQGLRAHPLRPLAEPAV